MNYTSVISTPRHSESLDAKSTFAFTLAEVLITLGIIGVVAALTIPSLMQKYQESVYINAFKETYSILSQAYTQAAQEYGTAENWQGSNVDAPNYFKEYLKTSTVCDLTVSYPWWGYGTYKNLNGTNGGEYRYQMVLVNGSNLYFIHDGATWILQVDTNGIKPPNQYGYDIFFFSPLQKNGTPILDSPYGAGVGNDSNLCKVSANPGWGAGINCSTWIVKHWNMDYLHRDISAAEWQN